MSQRKESSNPSSTTSTSTPASTADRASPSESVLHFYTAMDQGTSSKLVQDVWRTGVRVTKNDEGLVESCEIKRCLEMVMGGGERGEEIKRNVKK
ncbi:UDP-glycosyltransferase 75D1-like protein [Corchorus olitorius]|uniref:UDP-glycosyltransferase 75D1-like protein n=1 Tax=Corchorus olitorius TaxID=93759 RepID=A0A1R3J4D2_9ROSI|nr:UDP-glycosyltransferase 75D1-like protein [Corchorus olitorius]